MPVYRLPPQRTPLTRFVALLVFIAVIGLALVLGAIALVAVLGLALVVSLRYWWLRRRRAGRRASPGAGDFIEGEYTVKKEEPRRRD